MASAELMASSIPSKNSDMGRRSSSSTKLSSNSDLLNHNQINNQFTYRNLNVKRSSGSSSSSNNLGSGTTDGLVKNVYAGNQTLESFLAGAEISLLDAAGAVGETPAPTITRQESMSNSGDKTVDGVWREIVAGGVGIRECKVEPTEENMTLEDFLVQAGAMEDEDIKVEAEEVDPSTERLGEGAFAFDNRMSYPYPFVGTPRGVDDVIGGRRKRKIPPEPLDKAALQRQKRMIKNRESAARSRERKLAYQVELESLVMKLEEENQQLVKEKAERNKERFKQLMEKIVPVVEKQRPVRVLRRIRSMQW